MAIVARSVKNNMRIAYTYVLLCTEKFRQLENVRNIYDNLLADFFFHLRRRKKTEIKN